MFVRIDRRRLKVGERCKIARWGVIEADDVLLKPFLVEQVTNAYGQRQQRIVDYLGPILKSEVEERCVPALKGLWSRLESLLREREVPEDEAARIRGEFAKEVPRPTAQECAAVDRRLAELGAQIDGKGGCESESPSEYIRQRLREIIASGQWPWTKNPKTMAEFVAPLFRKPE